MKIEKNIQTFNFLINILLIFHQTICTKLKTKNVPILDDAHIIRVYFEAPAKPGDKETLGVLTDLKIFDHSTNQFSTYKIMIDTLSSAFWLISESCITNLCAGHNKYKPIHSLIGSSSIDLNNGTLKGNIYFTTIQLRNFILADQSIFLVNGITVPEFENVNIDGILGISRFLSSLHYQPTYKSVMQNIINQNLPSYFILKLGGSDPYMKFGNIDHYDQQYFKRLKKISDISEKVEWLNLIENGKLVLPLRHIRLIYKDKNNQETRWEFVMTHCIIHGCRSTIDTKSYYIYGPKSQLQKILSLSRSDCDDEAMQNLPDIEFSFYDVNLDKEKKLSSLTLDLTLEPKDYMINSMENEIELDSKSEKNCIPGFGDHGTQYGWNFGIMFLKKFVMIYDSKNEKLGFVRSNNSY